MSEYFHYITEFLTNPLFFADLPKPQLTLGVKVVKILVILCEVTVITIPMLQFALLTYAPCTSPFILSMLPKCRQITKSSHWLENSVIVLIHIFESWMCFHMMLAGTAGIIFVFFVGMVCLLGYLRILERFVNMRVLKFFKKFKFANLPDNLSYFQSLLF